MKIDKRYQKPQTAGQLMAALMETMESEAVQPHEQTYASFSEATGLSIPQVSRIVTKKVASGEMVRRKAIVDERLTVVFSVVGDEG